MLIRGFDYEIALEECVGEMKSWTSKLNSE